MSVSMKKRKLHCEDDEDSRRTKMVSTSTSSSNDKPIIYILPDCIGPKRLEIMKTSVDKMGFTLSPRMMYNLLRNFKLYQPIFVNVPLYIHRSNVTHVLSELETKEEVMNSKEFKKFKSWKGYILHAQWLAECVK